MALKTVLQKLGTEENTTCVTISLNTHRTHPDNAKDEILLKNLLAEAEERVTKEFGKRDVKELLDKIETVQNEIDVNYNLDSLHLFLSNDTKEIVRMPWPIHQNMVHISESFAIRPLIKAYGRSEYYLIMMLSQGGVKMMGLSVKSKMKIFLFLKILMRLNFRKEEATRNIWMIW